METRTQTINGITCNKLGKTVWRKMKCDKGNQWTTVMDDYDADGSICYFSGCKQDHKVHEMGYTTSRDEASEWFKNIYEEARD